VVGVIRLVEKIVDLAQPRKPSRGRLEARTGLAKEAEVTLTEELLRDNFSLGMKAQVQKKEIVKEGISEYFLYTVEGRDTIPTGWSKRLPSFKTPDVPITSYYRFEKERWGDAVMRYYQFTNSEPSKLGKEPLPDGEVKAFRLVSDDHLYAFVGGTSVKYIPINETVELELGHDREVLVKPTLMNWEKTNVQFDGDGNVKGWTIKETWQVEVQNSKDIDAALDVRRNFSGDWALRTEATYEKVDADKVKFVLPLKAREKRQFGYELTSNFGSNATR
jgi:hypothetical protein